jgi:hypothetical protein
MATTFAHPDVETLDRAALEALQERKLPLFRGTSYQVNAQVIRE